MARLRPLLVSLAAVCALASAPAALDPWRTAATSIGGAPSFLQVAMAEAKDLAALHRDLESGSDFRLRVSAALTIGQMAQKASVGPLSKALSDEHPAVRAAASAALGKIGERSAIGALEAAAARESVATVKNQHVASLAKLKGGASTAASPSGGKFVVKLGTLSNKTGVRSADVERTFRESTRRQVAKLAGAVLPGVSEDPSSVARAKNLPMVALDGSVSKLASSKSGGDIGWDAQVEYVIKQMPQQQLKGTIKGRGKALANAAAVKGQSEHTQLQTDAVNAAVESALGDASRALSAATN